MAVTFFLFCFVVVIDSIALISSFNDLLTRPIHITIATGYHTLDGAAAFLMHVIRYVHMVAARNGNTYTYVCINQNEITNALLLDNFQIFRARTLVACGPPPNGSTAKRKLNSRLAGAAPEPHSTAKRNAHRAIKIKAEQRQRQRQQQRQSQMQRRWAKPQAKAGETK